MNPLVLILVIVIVVCSLFVLAFCIITYLFQRIDQKVYLDEERRQERLRYDESHGEQSPPVHHLHNSTPTPNPAPPPHDSSSLLRPQYAVLAVGPLEGVAQAEVEMVYEAFPA